MKKFISIMLALLMLASAASVAVSAEIIHKEDFETGPDEPDMDFWIAFGNFQIAASDYVDGYVLSGWSDAKFALTRYKGVDGTDEDVFDLSEPGTFNEMTVWVDVNVEKDDDREILGAGFWVTDTYDKQQGYSERRTEYKIIYYAQYDDEYAGFVRLFSDDPTPDDNYPLVDDTYHIYGELALPEVGMVDEDTEEFVQGFNLGGETLRLGIRYGQGNITGYANGKIVASYNYETIGINGTPIILEDVGCQVEFDNFTVGTYDHDVKKETRNDSYDRVESDVVVFDGTNAATEKHLEDEPVTVTAPAAPAGQVFDKWQMKIGGREVSDAVKFGGEVEHITITERKAMELLYGIEIGDLNSAELTFTMPDTKVELTATYKEAEVEPAKAVTVVGGTADVAEADAGATVTITADAPADGMVFDKWEVVSGGVELANVNAATTTFTMGNADVEVKATYKVKDASTEYAITVNGGTASAEKAVTGTVVTITANEAPEGQVFDKWEVISGGVELANANDASTTFTMGEAAVEVKATYKSSVVDVTPGDVNGDTRVNAKDIIAVMKFMLGNAPEGFIEAAGDLNGDNRINAKDIILIMKIMLGGK